MISTTMPKGLTMQSDVHHRHRAKLAKSINFFSESPSLQSMDSSIVRIESSEEIELKQKLLELQSLKQELQGQEARLISITKELDSFNRIYEELVACKQQDLQRIQCQIDAILSQSKPSLQDSEIRIVYRKLAKLIHPDLAATPEEMETRKDLMTQANSAFDEGDIETLKGMLLMIECESEASGQALLKTKIEFIKSEISKNRRKLSQTTIQIMRKTQAEIYKTMAFHKQQKEYGKDHLSELSCQLDLEIKNAEARLRSISINR